MNGPLYLHKHWCQLHVLNDPDNAAKQDRIHRGNRTDSMVGMTVQIPSFDQIFLSSETITTGLRRYAWGYTISSQIWTNRVHPNWHYCYCVYITELNRWWKHHLPIDPFLSIKYRPIMVAWHAGRDASVWRTPSSSNVVYGSAKTLNTFEQFHFTYLMKFGKGKQCMLGTTMSSSGRSSAIAIVFKTWSGTVYLSSLFWELWSLPQISSF